MHVGDFATCTIVPSFKNTFTEGGTEVESAFHSAVAGCRIDLIQERSSLSTQLHHDELGILRVRTMQQVIVCIQQAIASIFICNLLNFVMNNGWRPGDAEWTCCLTVPIEDAMIVPTVNLKRAQQTLVFYCQSAKNYGDVVGARDLVSPPATFAGRERRSGCTVSERRQQLCPICHI